jgi:hypothetical protein
MKSMWLGAFVALPVIVLGARSPLVHTQGQGRGAAATAVKVDWDIGIDRLGHIADDDDKDYQIRFTGKIKDLNGECFTVGAAGKPDLYVGAYRLGKQLGIWKVDGAVTEGRQFKGATVVLDKRNYVGFTACGNFTAVLEPKPGQ